MDLTSQSLLQLARQGSATAWERMYRLYEPFVHGWLLRFGVNRQEVPDLCQDILTTLVEHLPSFRHSGRPGAFRAWLRTVTVNRAQLYWRDQGYRAKAPGGSDFCRLLEQLQDPDSSLSKEWDLQHQRHVLEGLLDGLAAEFEPATLGVFRRVALQGEDVSQVAEAVGMSVGAVYIAKSRVLRRLREEAADLLD